MNLLLSGDGAIFFASVAIILGLILLSREWYRNHSLRKYLERQWERDYLKQKSILDTAIAAYGAKLLHEESVTGKSECRKALQILRISKERLQASKMPESLEFKHPTNVVIQALLNEFNIR